MKVKVFGISIVFLLAILFYSFRLTFAFFHYALFNDDFTELYCVNIDKPELVCHGQCHLLDESKNESGSDSPIKLNNELHLSINLFYENSCSNIENNVLNYLIVKDSFQPYISYYQNISLAKFFEPPISSS